MSVDGNIGASLGSADGAAQVGTEGASRSLHAWDLVLARCRSGDVVSSVYETADALLNIRKTLNDPAQWRAFADDKHFVGLRDALREDPFTHRAVTKPRGYPGDAVLLDMAYRIVTPSSMSASRLGQMAFEATTNSPGSRSVRARKKRVAAFIDSVAAEFRSPRMVSVACGHLRELEHSSAFQDDALGEFLGIDQDAESISVVEERFRARRVTARTASLKEFLKQKVDAGPFCGMYSVGLFDYLDDATAAKVTTAMFRMLRPGGRLLIANLAPTLGDIAYMEAVMDWWMIYRSQPQLEALIKRALWQQKADINTFTDPLGNVAYAEIRRLPEC